MKRYVIMLSIVLGTLFLAKAQKIPTASELATKNIEELDKRLKLNPTQRNIIYNYTLDMYKEQLELSKRQQAGNSREDDIPKFYKLRNQTSDNIRNILKGDQQTEYDKFLEEQLRGGDKKKKKKGKHAKEEEEEVVTGIDGLKMPPARP